MRGPCVHSHEIDRCYTIVYQRRISNVSIDRTLCTDQLYEYTRTEHLLRNTILLSIWLITVILGMCLSVFSVGISGLVLLMFRMYFPV